MSEVGVTENLNQIVDAVLKGEAPGLVKPALVEIAAVAAELRGLPRQDFKLRLRNELEREVSVSSAGAKTKQSRKAAKPPKRAKTGEALTTVTPYVVVSDVHRQIAFIEAVFSAQGKIYGLGSQGGYHSEYRIGDSPLMIGGGGKGSRWKGTAVPVSLHVYVPDVDATSDLAIKAGATLLMPPTHKDYGERGAAIQDADGNHWYVATAFGPTYVPKGAPNMMPYFQPRGAKKMIGFLTEAFAAETLAVHESPDGVVRHAEVRIGASIVEIGEAHGQWQPRPMHFMVNVEDCDTAYERAMKAEGAMSVSVPANAPYGGRTGTIEDPFGNIWYLSSPPRQTDEAKKRRRKSMATAKLFRIAFQVGKLDEAGAFYAQLLDDPGIPIPRGSRHYFDCGGVILALVDVMAGDGQQPQPTPDYIYFAVDNLDEVFARAKALGCLATDRFHDQNAGEIVKRPWGERSFYCEDPWGNGLCFVDEKTLFTGK
jgi:uncharacterized glyoxalase superfamily protein PhnB